MRFGALLTGADDLRVSAGSHLIMHRPIDERIEHRGGIHADDGLIEAVLILFEKGGLFPRRVLFVMYAFHAVLKQLVSLVAQKIIIEFEALADAGIAVVGVDAEALPISRFPRAVPGAVFARGRIAHGDFCRRVFERAFVHRHDPRNKIIQPIVRIDHACLALHESVLLGAIVRRQGVLGHISVRDQAGDERRGVHGAFGDVAVRVFSRRFVLDKLIPTRIERHIDPRVHVLIGFGHIAERIVRAVVIGVVQSERAGEAIKVEQGFGSFELPLRALFRRQFPFGRDHAFEDEHVREFIVEIVYPILAHVQGFLIVPGRGDKPRLAPRIGNIGTHIIELLHMFVDVRIVFLGNPIGNGDDILVFDELVEKFGRIGTFR